MSAWSQNLRMARQDFSDATRDLSDWISHLSPAEQVLGICVFGLVMMWFMVRRPRDYDDGGGMMRQFAMALVIILLFSAGISWIVWPGHALGELVRG